MRHSILFNFGRKTAEIKHYKKQYTIKQERENRVVAISTYVEKTHDKT